MTGKLDKPRATGMIAPAPSVKRMSLLWAVPGHAAEIARLHAEMFPDPWDEAAVMRLLAHPGSVALVASHGTPTELSGFALAQIAADEAEILTLGVAADFRRTGVGKSLVEGIKRAAAKGGARTLFLEVAASNKSAMALYSRTGLVETARRKGYYVRAGAAPEDAIVMRCTLASAGNA